VPQSRLHVGILYCGCFLDTSDYPHCAAAWFDAAHHRFSAFQGINLVYQLNKNSPCKPAFSVKRRLRFRHTRNGRCRWNIFLLHPALFVRIPAVIPDLVLSFIFSIHGVQGVLLFRMEERFRGGGICQMFLHSPNSEFRQVVIFDPKGKVQRGDFTR
jgi:hypothetical protein